VTATPGTIARPGTPIAQATTTKRRVEVDLDASQAAGVEVGDRAQITLPDSTTTPGKVTHVGTVAASSQDEEGASGSERRARRSPYRSRSSARATCAASSRRRCARKSPPTASRTR
jgi:hypothetical protein